MPTYQYACTECDHAFEQVQSFTDDSLTSCPHCEGRLRKVFNAVGVVFKGSGFYRTDSRSEPKASATTSSGDSSGSGSAGDSANSSSGGDSASGSSAGSSKSKPAAASTSSEGSAA